MNEVTLGRVQFEGLSGLLRGTKLNTSSAIYVEHSLNVLPLNILNLATWSMYYVVAARAFYVGIFQRRELIHLKSLIII